MIQAWLFLIIYYISSMDDLSEISDREGVEPIFENYKQRPTNLQLYQFQVSGKTPKYIDKESGFLYKKFSEREHEFYEFIKGLPEEDERSKIKEFLPNYCGVRQRKQLEILQRIGKQRRDRDIWIEHIASRQQKGSIDRFILLGDLTFGFSWPNVLDVKLGSKRAKKTNTKFELSTFNSHKFRINGLTVGLKNKQGYQECFISKYHGQKITIQHTHAYLSLFFFDGEKINLPLLEEVIRCTQKLRTSLTFFHNIKFNSSSLFIAYDAEDPTQSKVKLIDFDKYQNCQQLQDVNILKGLDFVIDFLIDVSKNAIMHQTQLKKRDLPIFHVKQDIIPKERLNKEEN